MKLLSWNVNGLRASFKKGAFNSIFEVDPDLAESLKMITLLFYHPQPKQRR